MRYHVSRNPVSLAVAAVFACLAAGATAAEGGSSPAVERAIERLTADSQGQAVIERTPSGLATFVVIPEGLRLSVPPSATPEARATAFLRLYGPAFGLSESAEVRHVATLPRDEVGIEHVRYQQTSRGVPVTGAELIVHLREQAVVVVNGRTLDDAELAAVPGDPELSGEQAVAAARAVSTRRTPGPRDEPEPELELSSPRLELFNRGLFDGGASETRLAWFLAGRAERTYELIWVDAATGAVLLHFNQQPDAKQRLIYDARHLFNYPGTLVRSEGGPATGDYDADAAYGFAGDFYDYLMKHFERDSIDGAGQTLVLSVHLGAGFANAFWDLTREQAVFGDGGAATDDVVVHELTHGLTQHTANLYYFKQSGALSEAISDIFGETVDLVNRAGNDSAAVRWLAGEDWTGVGPVRNMMNPTALGSPGKTSDSELQCFAWDSGGVHTNSGVLNHAYALAVDGGSYNGRQIQGIGLDKASAVVYRALKFYLVNTSTFADADRALRNSCRDLTGVGGIQANDCTQLGLALDAVEMRATWPCSLRGNIAGTVTDGSGGPLNRIDVEVIDQAGRLLDFATTDSTGAYVTSPGLTTGTYFAWALPSGNYVGEVWNGIPCTNCTPTAGTPIGVTAGSTTRNIDFALEVGGRISGRITDSAMRPIPSVSIAIHDGSGQIAGGGRTDTGGNYLSQALPGGVYRARTINSVGLLDEMWDDVPCPGMGVAGCTVTSGTPISVVLGAITPDISFALERGGRISGTVVGDRGLPLANVSVRVSDSNGRQVASGTTDAAGFYVTTTGLPTGEYKASTTNSAGYVEQLWNSLPCNGACVPSAGTPIGVTAGSTAGGINFALTLGGRIAGFVTRADTGAPMASVGLEFYDERGVQITWGGTDLAGAYISRAGLLPGEYFVRALPSGFWATQIYRDTDCAGCDVTTGTPVTVAAGATTFATDFALRPGGRILGRVIDGATGAPLGGVGVSVNARYGPRARRVYTNARGDYVADGLPEGEYTAYAYGDPNHVQLLYDSIPFMYGLTPGFGGGTPIKVTAGVDTNRVDFALDSGGALTGRVVEAGTGQPLANVPVSIEGPGSMTRSCTTDAAGDYSLGAMPPGAYLVRATSREGQLTEYYKDAPSGIRAVPVDIVDGQTRGGIDLALPPGARVSGTVSDADTGAPLAKVAVWLFDRNGQWAAAASTDAKGDYTTDGVPAGRYYVRAAGNAGYMSQCLGGVPCPWLDSGKYLGEVRGKSLDVTAGSTTTSADFELQPGGRIAGTISRAGTKVRLAGSVAVFDRENHQVASARAQSDGQYVTDAGLADGDYYVAAYASGHVAELLGWGPAPFCTLSPAFPLWSCPASKGQAVQVSQGKTTGNVDFALTPGGAIAGRLTDAAGGFAAVSAVAAFDDLGRPAGAIWSDIAGGYRIDGLPAGTYYLRSSDMFGYLDMTYGGIPCGIDCVPWAAKPVTVVVGAVTADVDLLLRRGGRISGQVTELGAGGGYSGMEIVVYDSGGVRVTTAVTDREGRYRTSSSLPDGVYYVKANSRSTYPSMLYGDIVCGPGCDPRKGKSIDIAGGADATKIDLSVGLGLSIADAAVTEGAAAVFTVSLSQAVGVPVTVAYTTVAGTAGAGTDFTAVSGTVTLPPNTWGATIAVPTLQDTQVEAEETFTLRLSSPANAYIVDADGVGRIRDDDR